MKQWFYCIVLSVISTLCMLMPDAASAQGIQNMQLVTGQSGWLQANNRLFWTETQGQQWAEITPTVASNATIAGTYFTESGAGWSFQISSDQTSITVARTSDKGAHWNYSTIPSPFGEATPSGGQAYPFFLDAQHGWVMFRLHSSSAFRKGILFRTTDGGETWMQCPEPPVGGEVVFADALHGVVGPGPAGNELYSTADGGQTWQQATLAVPSGLDGARSTIASPHFTSSLQGSILRTFQTDTGTTVVSYLTSDAGATWTTPKSFLKSTKTVAAALASNGGLTGQLQTLAIGANTGILKSSIATEALPVRTSFTNESTGWVLFSAGGCDNSGACTQSRVLMGTKDGGASYFSLGAISGINLEETVSTAKSGSAAEAQQATNYLSSTLKPESSATLAGAMGFDACTLPTTATMQTWATSSPYKVIGAYIGGSEFACSSSLTNFTASWTSTVLGQGWEIIPIWVGMQAPGSTKFSYMMSTDPTTATAQGVTEADSAIAAMTARGMNQGSPILYDIEAYTYSNATYAAATQAFLQGWTTELHAKGYLAGVYSSHPEFKSWYPTLVNPTVDIVWYAYFFSSGVACGTTCQTVFPTNTSFDISASYWTNDHRMRQTSSSFNSTYGSVTVNVDEDWIDAAMVTNNPNTLTVAKSGTGTGSVASTQIASTTYTDVSNFTQISCGSTCTAKLAATDIITLQATADSGATFSSWTGCDSTSSNVCTVTVSASKTVTANFQAAAAAPTFSPAGGTYTAAQSVTLSSATSGASIYYTTDGSTPTTSSTLYSGAITVSSSETINAIAVASGYTNSAVSSATYTITIVAPTAATPTFSPAGGTYSSAQTVTISSSTTGATIYYTTNGSTPTTSSTVYSAPITVNSTETISAISVASGYTNSAVATATYTISVPTAATPTFSPAAGTYTLAQSVTISSTTTGASIYYTTDGTAPTTSSTLYSGAITVSSTETIKAIAIASGYANSAVGSATYTITAATLTTTTTSSSLTIVQGQSGTTTVMITPTGAYSGTLSFTCSGLPSYATCSFSPSTLTFSASSATQATTVTIATTAATAQVQRTSTMYWAFLLPIFLAPLALSRKARKFRGLLLALLVAGSLGLVGLAGCSSSTSGGGSTTVFSGTVNVNITSTASTSTVQVPITLKITK